MLMCRSSGTRADGSLRRVLIVRHRRRKFGVITREEVLSCKRDVLITGPNASGKTRWLEKINEHGPAIWANQELLYVRALDPLQRWFEDPRVMAFAEKKGKAWARLKGYERVDALIEWTKATRVILIVDDAHKLAGRKLDIMMSLCRDANIVVVSAFADTAISISLRMLVDRRNPQRIALASEAAYDATSVALWLTILAAIGVGWWQLAAVVGGAKVLAGGRRAAKQT